MPDGENPRSGRRDRGPRQTNSDNPRPPSAGGGERRGKNKRNGERPYQEGQKAKKKKEPPVRFLQEKPEFKFETPFNESTEAELRAAHKKALEILHVARPVVPRVEVRDDAPDDIKRKHADQAKKFDFHRTEDERLTHAFAYQKEQKSKDVQDKEARSHAFSEILEAMLLMGGNQLFGAGTTVLPAQFSDRKDATDVVVNFGNGVALAIDAATEQDVHGYDGPEWAPAAGEKKKGIREKMMRSYRHVANDYGNLTRVQYTTLGSKVGEIGNMPRVLVGLSQATIARIAPLWAVNPQAFDFKNNEEFRQIQRSVMRQLVAQTRIARDEEDRAKKKNGAPLTEEEKGLTRDTATDEQKKQLFWHAERTQLEKVMQTLAGKVSYKGGSKDEVLDPVIAAVDETTKNYKIREEIIAAAKKEQREFHEQQGFIQAERNNVPAHQLLDDAPLTPREQAFFDEHVRDRVNPAQREALIAAVDAFKNNSSAGFPAALLGAAAGGVPTRLFKRLDLASKSTPPTTEPQARTPEPPHEPPAPHLDATGRTIDMPAASVGAHLAALTAQAGKFETRKGRMWSRVKNGWYHALTSAAAMVGAKSAAWLLCGLGVGTLGALGGGVVAAIGAAFGLRHYFKKKGYMDDAVEREKAGARHAVVNQIKHDPLFRMRMNTKEKIDAEVDRRARVRNRINTAVLLAGSSAFSWGALELNTGGTFTKTLVESPWSEKVNNTLALFACATPNPSGRGAGAAAALYNGSTNGAGGGSGMRSGAAQSLASPPAATPRAGAGFNGLATSPDQLTNMGQNRGRGIVFKNTAPHPLDPRYAYDPNNPWASWNRRWNGLPAPRASAAQHVDCCYQGLGNIRARIDNGPIIQRFGSGYWNSSTSGSLQQSLGLPRRW